MYWDDDIENQPWVRYDGGDDGDPCFIARCECGRFVKMDGSVKINYEGIVTEDNATCKKCGRIKVPMICRD